MATKQTMAYQATEGTGIGFASASFILNYNQFTTSTTTGKKELTKVVPAYALRYAVLVETLDTFNEQVTIAIGIADAGNTWTSATTGTLAASTAYKHLFPYGAATIVTGAEHTTTAGESVHITLTHGSSYALITSGKIKVTLFWLQTQRL
jgi:hypothetical protein